MTDEQTQNEAMASPDGSTKKPTGDNVTSSTKKRWTYLMSFTSMAIIASFLAIVLAVVFGGASVSGLPDRWFFLYASAVGTSLTWTFGRDLYHRRKELEK